MSDEKSGPGAGSPPSDRPTSDVASSDGFAGAIRAHREGRLAEAERGYRQVLALRPEAPEVMRLLALVVHRQRQDPAAIELLERAIELAPSELQTYRDLAAVRRARGEHDAAIESCERGVSIDPQRKEAHDLLGNALRSAGRLAEAESAYREALALEPDYTEALSHLAITLRRLGRLEEAAPLARRALELEPESARHHANLGNILFQMGEHRHALAHQRQAVVLDPKLARGFTNLGMTLATLGRLPGAEDAFRRALSLTPADPQALLGLGNALVGRRRSWEAEEVFRRALERIPRAPAAWDGLAAAFEQQGRWSEAETTLRHADSLESDQPARLCRLSVVLEQLGRAPEAEEFARRAVALAPDSAIPRARLGELLLLQRRLDEAADLCRTTLADEPEAAWARFALANLDLLQGRFPEGLEGHEARWKMPDFAGANRLDEHAGSPWRGDDLRGRTILLWAEQGLGDAIQFARYAPIVAQRGARVLLAVHRPLLRLMTSLDGVEQLVERSVEYPPHDEHCPLLSLPYVLGTEVDSIPDTPYLRADEEMVQSWRDRLGERRGLRVGVAWVGNPEHKLDRLRSLRLDALAPLFEVPGVTFYALQKGAAAERARQGGEWPAELVDPMDEVEDFSDTAALLANLDLVISVDTSVAHLAGALGRPLWVLLPAVPDWRWMLDREDSPWYPTARLFRQPKLVDWESVLVRVAEELRTWVDDARAPAGEPPAEPAGGDSAVEPGPVASNPVEPGPVASNPVEPGPGGLASSERKPGDGFTGLVRGAARSRWTRLFLGLVALVFLSLGVRSRVSGPRVSPVATVDGTPIEAIDLQRAQQPLADLFARISPGGLSAEQREGIRRQALDGLIERILLVNEAAARGIEGTDEELRAELLADASLQADGRFSRERYDRLLRAAGWTHAEYEQTMRDGLSARKLREAVMDEVSEVEVDLPPPGSAQEQRRLEEGEAPGNESAEQAERRRRRLLNERRRDHFRDFLEGLRANAEVEIDERELARVPLRR